MKKIISTILFTILVTTSFAQEVGQLMRGKTAGGASKVILVDDTGKLQTSGVQTLATDTNNALKVNIASSQIQLASPVATDNASRTIVNIGSYSTVIPASITNLPAVQSFVINSQGELVVSVSTTSQTIVASISNLPTVQSFKIDSDSNLTMNVASWTIATIGVNVNNLPVPSIINTDSSGTLQVNVSSWTAIATVPVSITNLATGQTLLTASDGTLLVTVGGMATSTPLIASISNLPAGQDVRVDATGSLIVKIATDTTTSVIASVSNLPAVQNFVVDPSNVLYVNVSSQSSTIIASISNLPAVQQLKVDGDNNLSMGIASVTVNVPVQIDQNLGYKQVSTPTITITTATKYNIGSHLPSGTKGFNLAVYNGNLVANCRSNLASGSIPVGTLIASGSTLWWDALSTSTPDIWGLSQDNTLTCILTCW